MQLPLIRNQDLEDILEDTERKRLMVKTVFGINAAR